MIKLTISIDIGVDSFSAALIPLYMFSIFGTDAISPVRMHFVTWNVYLNFYLTHFEKYNTGLLYLPWAYDFTMWVWYNFIFIFSKRKLFLILWLLLQQGVTILLMITGIFGIELWKLPLPGGFSTAFVFEMTLYISGVVSSHPFIIYRIIQ